MRLSLSILMFLIFGLSQGQKTVDKRIDANGISSIRIDSDQIFSIHVTTAETNEIQIKSGIAGETFETMLLKTEIKNGTLLITTGRSAYYKDIDDKLAAHKVMSIELRLEIPKKMRLWIDSALASVTLRGSCAYINFNLSSGDCRLVNFRGSGTVNTKEGNIAVENPGCTINAESRNGKVTTIKETIGDCELKLRSIDGNIAAASSK